MRNSHAQYPVESARALLNTVSSPFFAALACIAVIVAALGPAAAQGLYGEGVPDDAAFIRFAHAAPELGPVQAEIDGLPFETVETTAVTPYLTLAEGPRQIHAGDLEASVDAAAGSFYTVAIFAEELVVVEDEVLDDPALALLALCNFSDSEAVSLVTADGETALADIDAGSCASVAVNAVVVDLVVTSSGEALGEPVAAQLDRGEAYTVFALRGSEGPEVILTRAELVLN